MTLESRPHARTMEELGVSYDPLTHKAFFDIVGRLRSLTHYSREPSGWDSYGYFEITGKLHDGKPTYDLFVKETLLPKEKAMTLTHEVVHIFWEEDVLGYKNKPSGNHPSYYDEQPTGVDHAAVIFDVGEVHEDKVEAEAKRFFKADYRMVLDTYRKLQEMSDANVQP